MDHTALRHTLESFETITLKKGEHLLESGKICQNMAFIKTGFLRMYSLADGNEITLWIGSKGKFITSVSSFVFQTSNFWNIQAVRDSELHIITREKHLKLCDTNPKWLEFDNLLLAHSFALLEKSLFQKLYTTAQQRLEALMKEEPTLFNHVPLQYIASMLGITPVSLSRLRRKTMK